jgi:hypothetical protein
MNREEFTKAVGRNPEVGSEDWQTIQTVYNFHPAIPEVGGKEKIASLFNLGGMGLLRDMLATAQEGQALEENIHASREALRVAQRAYLDSRLAYREWKNRKGYPPVKEEPSPEFILQAEIKELS